MGSSSSSYPTSVLGGLWTANNSNFTLNPTIADQSWPAAQSAVTAQNPGANNYFGYNPFNTASIGNYLQGQAQNAYANAFNWGNNSINQGNNFYNAENAQAQQPIQTGYNVANQFFPYVNTALQQGFDPQKALYNKLFQQQQDQANAVNAASGVATTPYGAGLAQQGNQNFDIAWQQAQLANQAQGAQTAAALAGAGMGAVGTGSQIGQNFQNLGLQGLLGLYGAANQFYGTGASTADQLASTGTNISAFPMQYYNQQQQQQMQDYLNLISEQNNIAAQAAAANTNSFNASTGLYGASNTANYQNNQLLGSSLSGLGSLLGGGLNYLSNYG